MREEIELINIADTAKETNLYGCSGFSIHGGAVPGSAVRNLKYTNIDSA